MIALLAGLAGRRPGLALAGVGLAVAVVVGLVQEVRVAWAQRTAAMAQAEIVGLRDVVKRQARNVAQLDANVATARAGNAVLQREIHAANQALAALAAARDAATARAAEAAAAVERRAAARRAERRPGHGAQYVAEGLEEIARAYR